jgi:hypothetical protein
MTVVTGAVRRVPRPAGVQLKKDLKKLKKATAQYGYFSEQGMHSEADMSYASLMYLMEVIGVESRSGLIKRRPFELAVQRNQVDLSNAVFRSLESFLCNGTGLNVMLEQAAKAGIGITKTYFGDASKLPSNSPATIKRKGKNAPLIDTGELLDNMAYKTSERKKAVKA